MKTVEYFGEADLYKVSWDIEKPIGVVQIVHGMVEHIERYDRFARFLNEKGYVVIGHDQRGHGQSIHHPEEMGVFPLESEKLIDDIKAIHHDIKASYPDLPCFLLGHSMGSYLVRCAISQNEMALDGVIIMGTGQVSPLLTNFSVALAYFGVKLFGEGYTGKFFNRLTLEKYIKIFSKDVKRSDWISRDKAIVNKHAKDKFCQFTPSLSMYLGIFRFVRCACAKKSYHQLKKDLPILLISGERDIVGKFGKMVLKLNYLYKQAGLSQVRLRLYPQARHEILNELNYQEVYQDIYHWLKSLS